MKLLWIVVLVATASTITAGETGSTAGALGTEVAQPYSSWALTSDARTAIEENKRLADSLLSHFFAGELEELLELVTEDFSFDVRISRAHPSYHLRRGSSRGDLRAWFGGAGGTVRVVMHEFEVKDVLVSPSRIMVFGYEDYEVFSPDPDGRCAVEFVWIYEVRDGKLANLYEVMDTETCGLMMEASR